MLPRGRVAGSRNSALILKPSGLMVSASLIFSL
ncbi:Uncharacterised protein [Mycobacterium tuberculosis]|nr:Uncharacterised protein [Mycobacterium tuberculosis]